MLQEPLSIAQMHQPTQKKDRGSRFQEVGTHMRGSRNGVIPRVEEGGHVSNNLRIVIFKPDNSTLGFLEVLVE